MSLTRDHVEDVRDALDRAIDAKEIRPEPIDFRSLRDSYATWHALAGIPDKRIQRRLGHASNTTTDRYIKAAEAFDVEAIGEPFPALPASLLAQVWTRNEKSPGKRRGFSVARGR
jgi:integrase